MSPNWQLVLIKCKREPWILPILLALLRVLICFLPPTGYLHPDEFFQSTDITGGRYFNSKINHVWEFSTDKPIRCMLIPDLLNKLAFKLATSLQKQPSAYLLLVAPKLIYTLTTFIIDFSLYKLCQYYSSRGLWYLPVSVIFQSSFACLGCLNRTLSNTTETIIFSLLLVVVCHTIRPTFRILLVTPVRRTPVNERIKTSTQVTSSCLVGALVTLGTFNRPTFPCFALVPCIYWVVQSLKRNSYDKTLTIQRVLTPLAVSALLMTIPLSAYDTIYYSKTKEDYQTLFNNLFNHLRSLRFDEFFSEIKSKWIFTPYNFIMYNTNVHNLAKYGLHLPFTHMLINVPVLFNLLAISFYGKLLQLLIGSGVYRLVFSTHRVYALMLLSTLTSIILLSFIPHQEFRFLLPLIVPLVYAFAFNIYTSNKLLSLWFIINLILISFYSNVHQAGVVRASLDLDKILKSHSLEMKIDIENNKTLVNVVALRCYLVPSYYWNIPDEDGRFNFDIQDTFNTFESSVDLKIGSILRRKDENPDYKYNIYIMMPRLYEEKLMDYLESKEIDYKLHRIRHYAFHFSHEDLELALNHVKKHGLRDGYSIAFGFSLLKMELD